MHLTNMTSNIWKQNIFRGILIKVKISDNFVNRKKNPITDEKRYLRGFHDKVLF